VLKTILKYAITATIGWLLSFVTKKMAEVKSNQHIAEKAVDDAAKETDSVVKTTKEAREDYRPASTPSDLAQRLRERDADPKAKAGSAGTNHDPGPVKIDPGPAGGSLPKPPNIPGT
jgi:hypothetical protein